MVQTATAEIDMHDKIMSNTIKWSCNRKIGKILKDNFYCQN